MKILYAIQGTGNGHLSRAMDIIPILQKKGDLDILVSGSQADIDIPYAITYRFKGLSFIFGKKGGVDLLQTYKKSNLRNLFAEIKSLPIHKYDLVINDFEPVSAWACYLKEKECISLSHQAAVLNKKAPQPLRADIVGRTILKHYAPTTTQYGFHFKNYDSNIFTPVIRRQVREAPLSNEGHYTVYLPAYSDKRIIKTLSECKGVNWHVFSKHTKKAFSEKGITILPINNAAFIKSMSSSEGVLCGAGFETPAEAMYLKKKLLVIPMKNQFEQHCNAAALQHMGIPVMKSLRKKNLDKIEAWLDAKRTVVVDYPDITSQVVDGIFKLHGFAREGTLQQLGSKAFSVKQFRKIALKKILIQLAG